ncbi:MAG: MaoC family dehydratase [Lachnospiraceae bacterium]|nr:MaoC family dehydratase [Lachnospiraceae bacterium]
MREYQLEDIKVGMEESFQTTITEEMMKKFLDITGDVNPLHNDEEYAKDKNHPGRVVYGMLTASFISTLGGVYLPGKNCLIQGVEVKFKKPVYIGDTLTVTGVVDEVHESVRQIVIKVTIKNQNGKAVSKGVLRAGVM